MFNFEDQFFNRATKEGPSGRNHTAFSKITLSMSDLRKDGARISARTNELHISNLSIAGMKKVAHAFSFGSIGLNLELDEEILNFEPEDGLVYKSKAPLWVLKKTSNNSVIIQRVWK